MVFSHHSSKPLRCDKGKTWKYQCKWFIFTLKSNISKSYRESSNLISPDSQTAFSRLGIFLKKSINHSKYLLHNGILSKVIFSLYKMIEIQTANRNYLKYFNKFLRTTIMLRCLYPLDMNPHSCMYFKCKFKFKSSNEKNSVYHI